MAMLAIVAALAAGSVQAQARSPPFDASHYPPEVRKALHHANEDSRINNFWIPGSLALRVPRK